MRRLLAVLLPFHQGDDTSFFREAVDSILGQEIENAEIRLYLGVDGPIDAAHEAALNAYSDRVYKIVRNDRRGGLPAILNVLIDALEDEHLVLRMDADDVSEPSRFRLQCAYMETHPQIALVGCQASYIDPAGRHLGYRDSLTDPDEISAALVKFTPLLHPTYCCRREIFRDPRIRYPMAYRAEDLAFLVVLTRAGMKVAALPDRLLRCRVGVGFFSRRHGARRGFAELAWYARAVRDRHGLLTWRYVYPVARLILRLLPASVSRKAIGNRLVKNIIAGGTRGA